jgi:hypothetical protein
MKKCICIKGLVKSNGCQRLIFLDHENVLPVFGKAGVVSFGQYIGMISTEQLHVKFMKPISDGSSDDSLVNNYIYWE